MAYFAYRARDPQGNVQQGRAEAADAAALAEMLRGSGWVVIEIQRASNGMRDANGLPPRWHPLWLLPMTSLDCELGLRQLASMLRSGVLLLAALNTVAQQASRPRTAAVWLALEESIRKGGTLSEAMGQHGGVFDDYVAQLVRVGEHSGEMDVTMTRAADHLEMHRDIKMLVVNALIYPVIATLMTVGVSAYLVAVVIPKIASFMEGGDTKLPMITQFLIDVSHWLHAYFLQILVVLVGVVVAWLVVRRLPKGRELQDVLLIKLPVVGRILRLSQTAVFARGLGLLVESGVTLLDSMGVVERLMANRRFSRRIGDARQRVMRGESLADSLREAREFFPLLIRMSAVAEQTGTLGATLSEVAVFHEKMLVVTIKRFSVLIEPLMIIITGGIVGFVYIAFFMALFSMVSGF
ncbi:MAG: type II secretion system F family protein [Lentisphaerae bacterium]|nr:type II secretion system F family protein [Lentisphaerota bacterium]